MTTRILITMVERELVWPALPLLLPLQVVQLLLLHLQWPVAAPCFVPADEV
jgi:hypothetical protein